MSSLRCGVVSAISALLFSTLQSFAAGPNISIAVDATEAPRKILHAKLRIPAAAGTLTLYYPKWIPGEHAPDGPVIDLTGLKFSAGGKALTWRRDLKDGWTINVEVPAGQNEVLADLDYLEPANLVGGFSAGSSATDKLLILSWNQVVLYPKGWKSDDITYSASLKIPDGWKYATSLPVSNANGSDLHFGPVSLTMLVDSPVLTGQYMKAVPLTTGQPSAELDVAADSAAALEPPQEVWDHYKNLVAQAGSLFGAQHYQHYHFLYTLSDHVAHFGLEHHESDDSRVGERGLVDETDRKLEASLLPHEYVHSWNGKYRRPAGLATLDYQVSMQGDLLWVYEGLTEYLGSILTARSGLWTPDQYREYLAGVAADLDHLPGRTWRNLQDTADAAPQLYFTPHTWYSWRRSTDFYDEDTLNWMWVDAIIRQQSKGSKSLDDFCKLFHGAPGGPPMVKPYTFEDVVKSLNDVVPYDWSAFWTERLTNHGPGAPLTGIQETGWKLVYDETPTDYYRSDEREDGQVREVYTIGLRLRDDGAVIDTIEGMMAAKAGIGPGMKIVAVNSRRFSADALHDAIKGAKGGSQPIELLVENTDYFNTYKLDYHEGEKYPRLVRDESKPDLMADILKAK
ncbi:MAG TPA: M61 family peptidase [Terriglobales bacterium]|nr:M61 family peptidase [Terriglobales bacterium]